ncbi:PIN2/TERF1-interacting telomerase inhibitor 1 [Apophysomyces ossiformis]|uniref:PIN2/TERF1-interacting telomerase inhibitor 1 n=1 Tax=Apophysomyces ossiformis TaxID=679940 RepID=A0A8H7ETK5_9FUNG|nr:PIN2/TERF1-interacting telomerase inhibitor 1 [Apophysomyces ossiformis]
MGLAGQKVKQRLSADPNNLHWSKDESKFGFRMLMKMGWAPGKGLGINEDGNKEHVKIRLKDNTLGVGATKKNEDNWLDNTDAFSRLLADLNSRAPETTTTTESSETSGEEEGEEEDSSKKTKRKRDDENEEEEEGEKKKQKKNKKEKKKKSKKEKKDKKEKKEKKEKKSKRSKKEVASDDDNDDETTEVKQATTVLRNAARAKFLRAKRMATQHDKARLNEILGIKPVSA